MVVRCACALQIEEAMLFAKKGTRAGDQPSSKRRRTDAAVPASEPSPDADEASWAALADVYMQLGEHHLAQVAYATRIARCALAVERQHGSYVAAEGLSLPWSSICMFVIKYGGGSMCFRPRHLIGKTELLYFFCNLHVFGKVTATGRVLCCFFYSAKVPFSKQLFDAFYFMRRCPGTREAMEAMARRRTLTAYTLFEALMRAVAADEEGGGDAAMDVDGLELTAGKLLGGQEPSKQEEDMWFQERSRWPF